MTDHSLPAKPADSDEIAALRAVVEGTANATGREFFEALVRNLARVMGSHHAFIAEFVDPVARTHVRTLAFSSNDRLQGEAAWELAGTPCEEVVRGELCHHPAGVARKFPRDKPLADMGIESYLGVPLRDSDGQVIGHLALFDERPMPLEPRLLFLFRIFAARAASELERLRMEERLRVSERSYRDLYEEAPIAYVQEGLDSRFISANRAAMRILGITPEQVEGTVGMSFIPDTPDAQRRVREAFESIGRGTDTSGVVLELRRRDDGRPIWIQWWSKPDPGGKYTRTMFVDITDRVLMEQEQARLRAQNLYLQEEIKSVHNFEEIIGQSAALRSVLDKVSRVAATDSTVLIRGETGTGKELIARAIHSHSPRKDRPLIKINCAALPSTLVESELFGHEKGAFTGAIAKRIGRFELAHGGTIFLDEVGEMPVDVQAKLLRVLQEHEFERLGSAAPIRTDVRVIAATNRDLNRAVREKTFREDLLYRLDVFPVHLPPLRERTEDIPLLVHFLTTRFAQQVGKRIEGVGGGSMERLLAYPWPGNIRELENVIERAVVLASGPLLEIESLLLGSPAAGGVAEEPSPSATLEAVERGHVRRVLERCEWVIEGPRGAARVLDLHPNTLRSRLKRLGISRADQEAP